MKRPLKTLFWGRTHEHACGKLETLCRLKDDFEIVAFVDDMEFAPNWYADDLVSFDGFPLVGCEESFGLDGIDVVFVETANAGLLSVASRFIDRGIPVHCDKPCGETIEPYAELVERCRVRNLPFQIGYMYRGNPAVKWIHSFVAEGGLGDVRFVEADMNHDYGYPVADYARYISQFGGGIFYNLACHHIDMIAPLISGDPQEVAFSQTAAPGYPEGSKTSGVSLMRFVNADALVRVSAGLPGGILCRRLRIDGTRGTIDLCPIERFDGINLKLTLTLRGESPREIDFGVQTDRYANQLIDLAAVVRGERPNDQDYDRDLRTQKLLLKACGM